MMRYGHDAGVMLARENGTGVKWIQVTSLLGTAVAEIKSP